jgi:HTH-type transcriptional regulator, transcriptional repressor of NAD biosynthesis genes
VQDGLRDGEHVRHEMHCWFEQALGAQQTPWKLLRGSPEQRVKEALEEVSRLFVGSQWRPTVAAGQPA